VKFQVNEISRILTEIEMRFVKFKIEIEIDILKPFRNGLANFDITPSLLLFSIGKIKIENFKITEIWLLEMAEQAEGTV